MSHFSLESCFPQEDTWDVCILLGHQGVWLEAKVAILQACLAHASLPSEPKANTSRGECREKEMGLFSAIERASVSRR